MLQCPFGRETGLKRVSGAPELRPALVDDRNGGRLLKVPLIKLAAQYESISTELDNAVRGVMASGMYVQGAEVERFEEEVAIL
jgi:hypothetical protein